MEFTNLSTEELKLSSKKQRTMKEEKKTMIERMLTWENAICAGMAVAAYLLAWFIISIGC